MSNKIIVECSKCKRVAEYKYGFFKKKEHECLCGNKIDLRDEKKSTCECGECGNYFSYDRIKNSDPECPVCHSHPLTGNEFFKLTDLVCTNCNTHLKINLRNRISSCPICGQMIDTNKVVTQQKAQTENQPILIKQELDPKLLVQKYPLSSFNLGSKIIVNDSQTAILINNGNIEAVLNAGAHTIEKESTFLSKDNFDNENLVFNSQLYFINNTYFSEVKWGTDTKVKLFDPISGLHVELGAFGTYTLQIVNAAKFLVSVVGIGTNELLKVTTESINLKTKTNVVAVFKSYLAKIIREEAINVLELDEHTQSISLIMKNYIDFSLEKYGLKVVDFVISAITTPDDDVNFKRMKEQYAERYLKIQDEKIKEQTAIASKNRIIAETEAQINKDIMRAQAEAEIEKIRARGQAEAHFLKAQAEAEEMKLKGFTYQDETNRKVAFEAMKNGMFSSNDSLFTNMAQDSIKENVANHIGSDIANSIIGGNKQSSSWVCKECNNHVEAGNFCPNCGSKRPSQTWVCDCGATVSTNFCPNCGSKRK